MGEADRTSDVDAYLAGVGEPQRTTLEAVRATLRRVLPDAAEAMKYGMPAFVVDGAAVAGYAGFKHHCGYFPMSGDVIGRAGVAVAGYTVTKGGLQFPVDRPLPEAVIRTLVTLRLDELAERRPHR